MTRKTRLHVETLDDRCVPATLTVGDVTLMEGTSGVQYATVPVTLTEPLNKTFTVSYQTRDSTAVAGSDYQAVSGTLTFTTGETEKTILVPVYGDQVPEYDESFSVRLFNVTKRGNHSVETVYGQGVVSIVDSSPRLSISATGGDEGGVFTFTVTLASALDTPFTVDFTTGDTIYADGPGYADAGLDYVATSGTLTFAPGETTKTFTVQTIADDVEEYDEMFFVRLSNPSTPALITGGGWYEFDAHGYIYGEWDTPPE
jgi:hypothetical protein